MVPYGAGETLRGLDDSIHSREGHVNKERRDRYLAGRNTKLSNGGGKGGLLRIAMGEKTKGKWV